MTEPEDSPPLTREEEIQVEMAMDRRRDQDRREQAEHRTMSSTGDLVSTVLARVVPLPNDLDRRWNAANVALRGARRDLKRAPDDPMRQDSVRMMERQVVRVWAEVCAHRALTAIRQRQLSVA